MTGKILLTFGALRDSSFIHPTGNRLCISYEFIFKMDSIQDRMKNYLHDLFSIVFLSANRKSHISLPFLSHIFFYTETTFILAAKSSREFHLSICDGFVPHKESNETKEKLFHFICHCEKRKRIVDCVQL